MNPPDFRRLGWLFLAGALLTCLLAINSHSLWIDEFSIAIVAQPPTLTAAWHKLFAIHGSDLQMPLYILWIWAGAKITGTSVLALRGLNALWFVPGMLAFALALPDRSARIMGFLLAVSSPFLWYYLNEARPYAMQAGTSLVVFAVILHWRQHPDSPIRLEWQRVLVFATALVLLGGSSLLCLILAAMPLLTAAALLPRPRLLALGRVFWPVWLTVLGLWLLTGIYYLWTLHSGARATAVAGTNWKNIVFVAYELCGFTGLGPGRLEMREGALGVFRPYWAPLGLFAVTVGSLGWLGGRELWRRLGGRQFLAVALAVALPVGFILAAALALHFRVLGRHFTPLLPVVLLVLCSGLLAAWRRGRAGRLLVVIFFAGCLASAASLRLASRHEKDNYQAAAAIALKTLPLGQTVWWNALADGAGYYDVPLATPGLTRPGVWALVNPDHDSLAALPPPDLVIASRQDVYDAQGAVAEFLARNHYRRQTSLTGFTIWTRGP